VLRKCPQISSAEPHQHFQMATEIATSAGSHPRRTIDDEDARSAGDKSPIEVIPAFRRYCPNSWRWCRYPWIVALHQSGTHCAITPGTQEPLLQVEMGGADDYALQGRFGFRTSTLRPRRILTSSVTGHRKVVTC